MPHMPPPAFRARPTNPPRPADHPHSRGANERIDDAISGAIIAVIALFGCTVVVGFLAWSGYAFGLRGWHVLIPGAVLLACAAAGGVIGWGTSKG